MSKLSENLERLEDAIAQACRRSGRPREDVELMAVTKTYPASTIAEAAELGLTLFGENRVQEFAAKAPELAVLRSQDGLADAGKNPIRVHLIGQLQSNKTGKAAELFDGVDSVDSRRVAERLNDGAGRLGKRLPVLIEVKLSDEETKGGMEPNSSEASQLLESLPDFSHLETCGLMTIAPWGVAEDVTRACFRSLREWRDRWAAAHPRLKLDVLSMGMSGDFAVAIEEGATRIRVGTALFGKRAPYAGPPMSSEMLRTVAGGVTLAVRVQPGAKKSAVVGVYGEGAATQLKIAVQALPIEGRANSAVIAFLAEIFSLSRGSVELISGESSRSKVFLLRGITLAKVEAEVQRSQRKSTSSGT